MGDHPTVTVDNVPCGDYVELLFHGTLDGTTYRDVRDAVVKAAIDEPRVLVLDVTDLRAPSPSAWSAFTSARWLVARWPHVPMGLVCAHAAGRRTLRRNGVGRYLPIYGSRGSAAAALTVDRERAVRQRARQRWPAHRSSLPAARRFVADVLHDWGVDGLIPAASVVATVLVDNVLTHTDSEPDVRLEADGDKVTVAVADGSAALAEMPEHAEALGVLTDLMMVSSLCAAWGNSPTADGKVVWAVLTPSSQI